MVNSSVLDFESMVELLSQKYKLRYSRVYDLLIVAEVKLLVHEPRKYIFNYSVHRSDAFRLLDKYFGIQFVRNVRRCKERVE